ncbi:hypothetical protein PEC106568_21130 [Pectobacterium carotovorum subsp. carotovorum]|nr:hypothetical protein PEC106568_21130 [Pectobacterium carotovorum subsp. carotovorum]
MAYNSGSGRDAISGKSIIQTLIGKCSDREAIYYLHFLQQDYETTAYVSGFSYQDMKSVRSRIEHAIFRFKNQDGDIKRTHDDMINGYHDFAIHENDFLWLKDSRRACIWILLKILFSFPLNKSILMDGAFLNIHHGSLYYSIIAYFDKSIGSFDKKDTLLQFLDKCKEEWNENKNNNVLLWLNKIKNQDDIQYLLRHLKKTAIGRIRESKSIRHADVFFEFMHNNISNEMDILMAFFDYYFDSALEVDSVKRKMASSLSSWRNREEKKEEFIDVHFDIKKENIPKLDKIRRKFNLSSKKEVVNFLIERFYDQND